ncbi:ABC transporter substrate-binding protein [Streptomyces sp. NBC_01498]|uniref:ABC transporter substrate-binding protein n=1 Tax=Streptomyces sp. NBC_01498 TaxID=2975870 RepID=UPI002E7C50A8|nr:ABC transporter substrate-binding protein [Streptomyces sp. NBC_01498]WTL27012.1 ABC transporter substrate-binding protein [Streptomyces sp. NBC_01498]
MKISRRRSALAGAATVLALVGVLAGCGDGASDTAAGSAPADAKMTIGLPGIPPIFLNTVMYVGEKQGFFKDRGLDVTLRPLTTGADVGRAVQSGEIQGGIIGTPGAVALRATGGSVVAVMGFPKPTYLLASTDPAIDSCDAVKGKTVAVDAVGAPKALALGTMLKSCGLGPKDVSTINVGGPPTVDALVAGQVKVAVLHPDELATVQEKIKPGTEAKEIMTLAGVDPLEHYTVLVAPKSALEGKAREQWVDMVAGVRESIAYMNDPAHLKEVAAVAAGFTKEPSSVTEAALPKFLSLGVWPKTEDGLDRAAVEHTIEGAVAAGNVPKQKAPTYDDMVDPSVFADATGK